MDSTTAQHMRSKGHISDEECDRLVQLEEMHQSRIAEVTKSDEWICTHSTWIRTSTISAIEDCGCSSPVFHLNNGTCVYTGVVYPDAAALSKAKVEDWLSRREHSRADDALMGANFPDGLCLTRTQYEEVQQAHDRVWPSQEGEVK